jgi:hypothetical protein
VVVAIYLVLGISLNAMFLICGTGTSPGLYLANP